MSHVKAGGTAKNTRDSQGQRLGIKLYGGQKADVGKVIVRQVGQTKRAGKGTKLSRNFTIHAHTEGVVVYTMRKVRLFTGKSVRRVEVTVEKPVIDPSAKPKVSKLTTKAKARIAAEKAAK